MIVEAKTLRFTEDWFTQHIPAWTMVFRDYVKERGRFLELGSFEGRSACWLLENALAEDGELVCVDTWSGSPEFASLPKEHVEGAFDRFCANIIAARKPTQFTDYRKRPTHIALADLLLACVDNEEDYFDFIYIDAAHQAFAALTDAVMAWPLLKTGGVMIFDDYTWSWDQPLHLRPKIAIDAFLNCFYGQLEPLLSGAQMVVRKI